MSSSKDTPPAPPFPSPFSNQLPPKTILGTSAPSSGRSFIPMENNFGSDIFEDDIFYLEASDSIEGPPAKRIYERVNWRVCNHFIYLFVYLFLLIYNTYRK